MATAAAALRVTAELARDEERAHARVKLQTALPLAAATIRPALRAGDMDRIDAKLEQAGARTGVLLVLHNADGDLLGRSSRPGAARAATGGQEEIREALAEGVGEDERASASTGLDALHMAVRVEEDGRTLGVLRGHVDLDTQPGVPARGASRTVLLALLALLAVALGTLRVVSRRVDGRIDSLADAALRFAAGDLGHRVDTYASRELGGLAEGLNEMAAQLEQRVEQLGARAAEQRAMLQSMSAGMVALDQDQRILRSNPRADALLRIGPEIRTRGRMLQEVARIRTLNDLLDATEDAEESIEGDVEVGDRIVHVTIEPLIDAERGRLGLLVLLSDITTLRRLERLRGEFAANVSHELRTPVTNIKGYAETLLDAGEDLSDTTARFVGVIARNAGRLEAIIEDLLALAGLERQAEDASIHMEDASAARILSLVVDQFEQAAVDGDIRLSTDVDPELEIVGGVHLIEQALANLVSNAIRYCAPGTSVVVSAHGRNDEELEFAVTDEGPGIAPEHLPRIFERFYRVDHARSRDLGGTGLGLAIVKHVAMAHGGRAEVTSELGRGTRFAIILPRRARLSRMSGGEPGTARPKVRRSDA